MLALPTLDGTLHSLVFFLLGFFCEKRDKGYGVWCSGCGFSFVAGNVQVFVAGMV
jgi:hypothetical protein